MTTISSKRLMYDIKKLRNHDCNLEIDNNIVKFDIHGPEDTPYYGGKWKIQIIIGKNYPFKSPSVGFITPIYHPNIDEHSGSICLNVLNQTWTPIYTLEHILVTFIPQLLTYPNPNDPLNIEAAELLMRNPIKYNEYIKSKNYCG